MTPHQFIEKWRGVELKERSASQSHFNDLCRLLDEPEPVAADPKGDWFTFEKGASKTSGGEGWADVWRKECFAWEYKGRRANLDAAFRQLLNYSIRHLRNGRESGVFRNLVIRPGPLSFQRAQNV